MLPVTARTSIDNFFDVTNHGRTDREGRFRGYIGTDGELIIDMIYDDLDYLSWDRILFRSEGKCGFLDGDGTNVIGAKYASALSFADGLAAVCA